MPLYGDFAWLMYLQWLFFKRIFAGHSPLRLTAIMTLGNVLVGLGSFYYLSQIIGQHGLRGQIYAQFGGLAGFLAVGISASQSTSRVARTLPHAMTAQPPISACGIWSDSRIRCAEWRLISGSGGVFIAAACPRLARL